VSVVETAPAACEGVVVSQFEFLAPLARLSPTDCASYMRVESMSELLDELERVRDRQEKIIALLRKIGLKPDVRFTLDDAIKQAEHDLDEYNALLTRYGRSGNQ
jgi:hypothetical protein